MATTRRVTALAVTLFVWATTVAQSPWPLTLAARPQTDRARRVWSEPGLWPSQSLARSGRLLVFVDPATADVRVRDMTTGNSRRLTTGGGWSPSSLGTASSAVISPDEQQVAYVWRRGAYELRVLPLTGDAEPRLVTSYPATSTHFVEVTGWTADGKALLVVEMANDRNTSISFVSVADGSRRALTSLGHHYPRRVSIMADGRFVAYDRPGAGQVLDVFVLSADGSRDDALVRDSAEDSAPIWSPDGSRLVFYSDRDGAGALWSIPVKDGRPAGPAERIAAAGASALPLGMTDEGTLYYFTGGPRRNVQVAELDGAWNVVGDAVRASARFIDATVTGSWSPDGDSLAYYTIRGDQAGSFSLVIRSNGTGVERVVSLPLKMGAFDGSAPPRWFPDSRSVLVAALDLTTSPPRTGFYRVDVATGAAEMLHASWSVDYLARHPHLSPDGKVLYYSQSVSPSDLRSWNLFRLDLDTRQEVNLRKWMAKKVVQSPALSPDGSQLAYLALDARSGALEVMPSAGGPSREVVRLTPWFGLSTFSSLGWTPDGRHLLFVWSAKGEVSDTELYRVPVGGGTPVKMGITLNGHLRHPQVRPDGRQLTFSTQEDGAGDVWAIERVFTQSGTTGTPGPR